MSPFLLYNSTDDYTLLSYHGQSSKITQDGVYTRNMSVYIVAVIILAIMAQVGRNVTYTCPLCEFKSKYEIDVSKHIGSAHARCKPVRVVT